MTRFASQAAPAFRPFWLEKALSDELPYVATSLQQHLTVDVCIVGGGYTGLWTAIELKQRKPDLAIAVLEKEVCGFGASGSNGGCALTLAPKFLSLRKFYGEEQATQLVVASEMAVGRIKEFTEEHSIACDFRVEGAQYVATNDAQVGAMDLVIKALTSHRINSWCKQSIDEARQLCDSTFVREAYFSPCGGSLQPAQLVRGLARVAREMGVQIYEHTPMTRLDESSERPGVETPEGKVTSRKVVLAMNAWMPTAFQQFARNIVVVSSDMAITEPVPELLEKIRLRHGASICDSRIFVHYFRSTSDGRLLFGKGGNTFAFGSKMIDQFFEPSKYDTQLTEAMHRFFPILQEAKIEQAWNGGSDRSTTGFPFFGNLNNHPNIHYGFGYSGNGVVQTWLGGQILASLCLDTADQWSRCGLVGGPRGTFPPEPFRWLGSLAVRGAIRRKESAEDAARRPAAFDKFMARFAQAAGKSDK